MTSENKEIDINKELEELPNLIAYQETLLEDDILEIERAKNEKNKKLADVLIKYEKATTIIQKAMYKKVIADENDKILKLKEKSNKNKIKFNELKNKFQSVRKIASLKIEEMKHFDDKIYGREVKNK